MEGVFGQGSFGTSNVFGTSNFSNPFASNTTETAALPSFSTHGSVFGGSATNVFGAPSTSPFPAPNQGSCFVTSATNVFGAPSTSPFPLSNQGSVFGSSATHVFGAPSSSSIVSSPTFAFGKGSGSNNSSANPFAYNTFGNASNSGHNPFATNNTFGATSSPSFTSQGSFFGGSSTGVFGAPPASSSSFTFGKPPAFSGSLSTSGTTSIGSLGAFGSTTSRGAVGVSPSFFGTGSQGAIGSTTSNGAFGVSPSIFGNTSTGSLGAFGSTASKGAFGESSSIFGTRSIGNHGAFGSTTSKGAFGESSSSMFGTTSTGSHHGAFGPTTSKGVFRELSMFGTSSIGSHDSLGSTTSKGAFGSNTGTNAGASTFGPFNFGSNTISPSLNSVTGITNPFQTNSQPVLMQNSVGSRIKPYANSNVMEGSDTRKLISISAMPFYESKSHEEFRWEDYELKSGGQSNSVNDQASGINKGLFVFTLPSVTSSLPTISGNVQVTANNSAFQPTNFWPNNGNSEINTNSVNNQVVGINKEQLVFPLPSVTSSWSTNVFGCDQLSANNFAFQPTKLWLHNENLEIKTNQAPSPWTAPHISTGNNGGASLYVALPQPSISQFPGTGRVMESIIAVKDPFGSEPATSRPFLCHSATSSLIQHGISSMPVSNKPEKTRVSSYFTSRHHSLKPLAVNVRKYHPSSDGPKVPFFDQTEEIHFTSKAYSHIFPRENPRSVFATSTELTHVSTSKEVASPLNHASAVKYEDGCNVAKKDQISSSIPNSCNDHFAETDDSAKEVNELVLPKLQRFDYYTEPKIEKLASIESLNPGFCFHVKDFVVGRDGYGWVKFYGETNVCGLNLDSIIQFNYRELIVYADASEKPPVGQGLNKAAEVTLQNIKCIDRSGKQYTSGKMVDKYIEKLKKVTDKQGAEFVSYDPVKEEWKFSVQHF